MIRHWTDAVAAERTIAQLSAERDTTNEKETNP